MSHWETLGTTLERANLEFVMNKKGKTGGTWGFGIFEVVLWEYTKFFKEHVKKWDGGRRQWGPDRKGYEGADHVWNRAAGVFAWALLLISAVSPAFWFNPYLTLCIISLSVPCVCEGCKDQVLAMGGTSRSGFGASCCSRSVCVCICLCA